MIPRSELVTISPSLPEMFVTSKYSSPDYPLTFASNWPSTSVENSFISYHQINFYSLKSVWYCVYVYVCVCAWRTDIGMCVWCTDIDHSSSHFICGYVPYKTILLCILTNWSYFLIMCFISCFMVNFEAVTVRCAKLCVKAEEPIPCSWLLSFAFPVWTRQKNVVLLLLASMLCFT